MCYGPIQKVLALSRGESAEADAVRGALCKIDGADTRESGASRSVHATSRSAVGAQARTLLGSWSDPDAKVQTEVAVEKGGPNARSRRFAYGSNSFRPKRFACVSPLLAIALAKRVERRTARLMKLRRAAAGVESSSSGRRESEGPA